MRVAHPPASLRAHGQLVPSLPLALPRLVVQQLLDRRRASLGGFVQHLADVMQHRVLTHRRHHLGGMEREARRLDDAKGGFGVEALLRARCHRWCRPEGMDLVDH